VTGWKKKRPWLTELEEDEKLETLELRFWLRDEI
jgi:hypothetical protein